MSVKSEPDLNPILTWAGGPSQLLTGADPLKDQSYFLASVPGAALRDVLFPLGALRKADVRRAAAEAGVPSAHRRSSAGLCFVGECCFRKGVSGPALGGES